uniref:Nuclease HARBI1 n=1 Tax=Diabrotica virgifera virgifera TaxID=50390 RepID=A0A6P7GN86_DIAVI
MRGFPRVIGCIDGSHIKITSPGGNDAEIYRNRKGYFSINIQAVCSADGLFQSITARWPGSAHDQTILNNTVVKQRFMRGDFANGVLLGDGGYTCTNYLLTPLRDPQTEAERRYNQAHIGTRVKVEQLFGVWKRRFPIMAYGCRLSLTTVLPIIVATACLHNVAVRQGKPQPPANDDIGEYIGMDDNNYNVPAGNRNSDHVRRLFIQNYFAPP